MLEHERWEDLHLVLDEAVRSGQARIWTKLPCKVLSVNMAEQTVMVQSQLKGRQKKPDKNGQLVWQDVSMPPIPAVIKFPEGGGAILTFPIKVDDQGTVEFCSRCIDNWWQGGGEQPVLLANGQGSLRQHNLSDAFYTPGGRPKPSAISNVSTTTVQMRSEDGSKYTDYDPATGEFKVVNAGGTFLFGNDGKLYVPVDVVIGTLHVVTHVHDDPQGGVVGPPHN